MVHVAGSFEAFEVKEHERFTMPMNEPCGATVMVDVLPDVAPAFTVMSPLFAVV